jgi:hemolysin D
LETTLASLSAQKRQKEAERDRLKETIRSQRDLVATLNERVAMRTSLVASSSGTLASLIDATETLLTQQAILSTELGQQGEAEAAIDVATREIAKAKDTFLAENQQKLAEAERQADDLGERLAKAREHTAHMTLRSAISGTVSASSVTTIGQVVVVGEELMRIVPDGSVMEIEAYLQNKDVGFVQPGQDAEIKIESLPFTRYGTIPGTIVRVAGDAIPEPDAQIVEGNPARSNRSNGFTGGAQRTQNLVFPVVVRPDKASLLADGRNVLLSPGMAVTIEVKTGQRRILEYIFSPLVEVGATAMHER